MSIVVYQFICNYTLLHEETYFFLSFQVIKESLDRELKNNDLLVHSEQLLVQMISPSSHSTRNKLKVLESISFSDLTSFIPGLRSQVTRVLNEIL